MVRRTRIQLGPSVGAARLRYDTAGPGREGLGGGWGAWEGEEREGARSTEEVRHGVMDGFGLGGAPERMARSKMFQPERKKRRNQLASRFSSSSTVKNCRFARARAPRRPLFGSSRAPVRARTSACGVCFHGGGSRVPSHPPRPRAEAAHVSELGPPEGRRGGSGRACMGSREGGVALPAIGAVAAQVASPAAPSAYYRPGRTRCLSECMLLPGALAP